MLLGKGPGEGFGVLRVGARQRRHDPSCSPGGELTASDRLQDLIRQGTKKRQPPADPALVFAYQASDRILRQFMAFVKLSD